MAMRVGDQERERAVAALRKQFADGHLSLDEFGERVEQAYSAVTVEDLNACLQDLPVPVKPVATPPRPASAAMAAAPPSPASSPVPSFASAERTPMAPSRARQVAKRSFYAHLGPYVCVQLFLIMIYVMTDFGGYFWPIWPMMGWGVGLGIHAWGAFVVAGRD